MAVATGVTPALAGFPPQKNPLERDGLQLRHLPHRVDVTTISGPVPMKTGGVIKPPSIAGGLLEAYAPGEPSAIYMHSTLSCAVLPINLLPVTIQKAQYIASGRLRLQKFIPESAVE